MENKEHEENCPDPKEEYDTLANDLPEFEKITEDFEINKVFEKESECPLRDIRHAILEKITAYSQLFETFQSPSSPPMFIFSLIRNITEEDKAMITKTYNQLAKIQIESIKLDTIYKEENEIKFIKETFSVWQEMKVKILELLEKLDKKSDNKVDSTTRGYFG
jgi:hypothetical protein